MMAFALSINLNKIALLRNSREGNYPSVIEHAKLCLENGVDGITVHPRPDQRHIRPSDCLELKTLLADKPQEFNIEGNPFEAKHGTYPGFIEIIRECKPEQATLVPDQGSQLTSDHGFDLNVSGQPLESIVNKLKSWNIRVSLFMDPDREQIRLAKELGADRIELYTGPFAHAYSLNDADDIFKKHCEAAQYATEIGLGVNAGHDLNLDNMKLYKTLPGLLEVSIGHAFTVDSLQYGMKSTIERYLELCR
ncbi:pyridoxine 5'-phosphate synthase [Sessilibacter sp. MAH2]